MTISTESLKQKIESAVEQLVRQHLIEVEAVAAAAVREGFRRATKGAPASSREPSGASKARRRGAALQRRRPREEMAKLEARLYEAICTHPGETMVVLAPVAGASAQALSWPAKLLQRSGRVRTVGQRQLTRYFPMDE